MRRCISSMLRGWIMTRQENIEKAIKLVDELSELSDSDRETLKKWINEAAQGSEEALKEVILFPYSYQDREIFSEIFLLILKK